MTNIELLSRITVRPGVFGGKPIIRDLRIAVEHVLGMQFDEQGAVVRACGGRHAGDDTGGVPGPDG